MVWLLCRGLRTEVESGLLNDIFKLARKTLTPMILIAIINAIAFSILIRIDAELRGYIAVLLIVYKMQLIQREDTYVSSHSHYDEGYDRSISKIKRYYAERPMLEVCSMKHGTRLEKNTS